MFLNHKIAIGIEIISEQIKIQKKNINIIELRKELFYELFPWSKNIISPLSIDGEKMKIIKKIFYIFHIIMNRFHFIILVHLDESKNINETGSE